MKNLFNSLYTFIFFLLLCLTQITYAQADSCNANPDIVYFNGSIITMDDENPAAEAIAIKADTIVAVGTNENIFALINPECETKIIDLHGLTILPGFNDAHSHWFSWRQHICSVSGDTTYPSLEEIMTMLSENGWTSISELNFGRPDVAPEHLNNALDLESRGKLSVRLNGYWGTLDDGSLIDVLADSSRTPNTFYTDRIKAPGVKIYVDDPFGTTDILTQEQVNSLVQKAHSKGWQIAAHAVNESAVEKILTAYENVIGTGTNENYRYRIEHAVKVSDNQLNRMKQKGIIASFQLMGPPDWPAQTTFQTYISNTHPEWCLRWNDFENARKDGLKLVGSTDAPFNDTPCEYSPFRIIYQAVTRKGYIDRVHADWELNQRISIEQAIKLLTLDGAYATFEENKKGSLTSGKWADFVIVSKNPLDVSSPEELLGIKVIKTVVGGKAEYCNDLKYSSLCSDTKLFSFNSTLISASNYLPDQPPIFAFDDNLETVWSAGELPPQWIQIDFLKEIKLDNIELIIDQWPAGNTTHEIWGKIDSLSQPFTLLKTFTGFTQIDDSLIYIVPPTLPPVRYIKIKTIQSPSWVAWKDIKIREYNPTSVNEENLKVFSFSLDRNYPNPFNPTTTIKYSIPTPPQPSPSQGEGVREGFLVSLKIYDVLGREVGTLVDKKQKPGAYKVEFNASNLPSGVYLYRIKAGNFVQVRKMILLK